MQIAWGNFWQRSRKPLKTGWLIAAGLIALYIGAIQPRQRAQEIRAERETGLSASAGYSSPAEGLVGAAPGSFAVADKLSLEAASVSGAPEPPPPQPGGAPDDRRTIRNGEMDLIVKNPRDSSEAIRQLAERVGGFLVSSEISGEEDASSASLTIRVPAARFEEARGEIRKLGLRVDSEKLEAEDVTRQYVDQSARLRNLRAQETQYLGILKQAKTVEDTLKVSDKLNEVRGEIEQQQAEFDALSKQVETVALTISLRAEADAKVFGLNWRPLYQLKLAARQGLDSIGDYAASMAAFLFYLPTVLLWLATILIGAAAGWRILRWAGKALFVPKAKTA
jgi:cell division protein FtsL